MRIHHPGPPEPPPRPDPERPWPEWPYPGRPLPQRPAPPAPLPSPPGPVPRVAAVAAPDPLLERLLDQRIVYLGRDLDDDAADRAVARLLLLGAVDPRRDVTLYVGALHASPAAGLALCDALRTLEGDVDTRAVGLLGSVGALLLAAGTPGRRLALPHARILLGYPSAAGLVPDPAVRAGVGTELRQELLDLLSRYTGRPTDGVQADLAAERRLTATEAVEYGLADGVVET